MGLALLPASKIEETARSIGEEINSDMAKHLIEWYQKYWIKRWGPKSFSVFDRTVRTDNGLEGRSTYFLITHFLTPILDSKTQTRSLFDATYLQILQF